MGRATWIASCVLLTTSDDTRALLWHELSCLLAWSCVRPRRHSSQLHLASLSCITTRTVCVLSSQSSSRLHSCVWVGRGSFGVRACTPVRGSGAATLLVQPTLCKAFFPRASGRRLHCVHLDRAPWLCSAVEFAWLARPFPSRLLRLARARQRLVTPAAVAASLTRCLVVGGHHSTISAFC